MEITCKYQNYYFMNGQTYTCKFSDQFIPKNAVIKPINSYVPDDYEWYDHRGKSHVLAVLFKKCRLSKIPQGLTKIFPNMKILSVWNSTLKNFNKNDLIEYKNLERIGLCNNQIEFVRGDLFEGFESLVEVSIYGDKINLIEPNILDGLDKLDYVQLGGDKYPIKEYKATKDSLVTLKDELILQYFKNHKEIKNFRKIDNLNKQYKAEVQKLIEENQNLQKQLIDKNQEITKLKKKENPENKPSDVKLFLQNDKSFQDLKIVIDDREFPVHKILIASRSPTLAELLKNNPEVENLNLVDISVEIFEKILKFLYTDELPVDDGTNFLHLFAAAGKLKIEELKEFAGTKLFGMIDENNALDILKMSSKYEDEELNKVAFELLKNKYPKVEFEDEWTKDIETLTKVIEGFEMKEELIRKAEEEFQNLILKSKNLV